MNHYEYNYSTIEKILRSAKIIAVVGLSSRKTRAGYYVPAYLQNNGYRIIPVNPHINSALGERAYPTLLEIPEPVDLVLIFRRSEQVMEPVEEAIQIGAKAVWMQQGIFNLDAAERAQGEGLDVVMDACMLVEHRRWAGG
jgi:hypothetical protein